MTVTHEQFDYIVVGAGSAGCVLANRLSADPANKVCLIEGGGRDRTPRIHVPAGTITLYKSAHYAYQFYSTPQAHLRNRVIHVPRGRTLGGSSSINSMIYIRGHRSDYDTWAQMGCRGWSFDEVLPYFKRSEGNRLGQDPAYHGHEGELLVDRDRDHNPLSDMFVEAAEQVGLTRSDDFNGAGFEGVGIYNLTQKNGQRLSSYRAFVKPIETRSNLKVITDCTVRALIFEGKSVVGVAIEREEVGPSYIAARREVVLAAGALGSPQILMASGIGDAAMLQAAGVTPVHDLRGVGANLQDHLDGLVTLRSHSTKTLGFSLGSVPNVLASPLRYVAQRKGWLTTNYVEAGGFARTRYADDVPDVQFHFVPGFRSHRGRLFEWSHGFAIHTCLLRPQSRGAIRLKRDGSRDIDIDFNFLAVEQDGRVLTEGMKLARKILNAPAFDAIRGREMAPGKDIVSDEQFMDHLRDAAQTVFHPSGTCRMGHDEAAVVTPELKVVGLDGLRVADASIMPTLVSGNTNAPSIMIGEKAADMMLAATRQ